MIEAHGVTSYLVCPLCGQVLGSSSLAVRGHTNRHIRHGDVAEADKRSFEDRIYDEGRVNRVNRGKKDWVDV